MKHRNVVNKPGLSWQTRAKKAGIIINGRFNNICAIFLEIFGTKQAIAL